jgi:diguanylate cyclase (GGDEF)-like protein
MERNLFTNELVIPQATPFSVPPVRGLATLCLPGGLLILAGAILFRPGVLPDVVLPSLRAFPYLVLGAGTLLGWYFNRSRIVFGILILTWADLALRLVGGSAAATGNVGGVVFAALAVLLPLNLAACAVLRERGLFTAHGAARFATIAAQILAVDTIIRWEWASPKAWLTEAFLDPRLSAWTGIPQTALAAFLVATTFLTIRCVRRRDPIETGFLWAVVAAFLALHGIRWGWVPTASLATAGLVLIWAVLETTYRMAYYDELTGLPGRRALNEAMLQVGSRYTVAMVDVDHFKRFNDLFGHEVGDQALRMVASKLNGIAGGGKAFRYGGEEFVVLFPHASAAEAVPHLEATRRTIASACFVVRGPGRPRKRPTSPKPPAGPHVAVSLTVSIGVGEPDERKGNAHAQEVLRAADKALYRAKSAGRNRLMV